MPLDTFDTTKRLPDEGPNLGRLMHIRSKDFAGTTRYEDVIQIGDAQSAESASVTRIPPPRNTGAVAVRLIPTSHENNVEELLLEILGELRVKNGKTALPFALKKAS